MAYIKFKDWNPGAAAAQVVIWCRDIIENYQAQGYKLTLRQLYYQLVSRDWIPNTQKSYDRLGDIVSRARLAGYLDWAAIEDRGRVLKKPQEWTSMESLLRASLEQFRLNRWYNQERYVECWVEKEALSGVLEPACKESHHIRFMANKGYSSQTAMFEASRRFIDAYKRGQTPVLLYLGDHDPSGNDMVRDIRDRLTTFGIEMTVDKLALTYDQVQQYNPPPNPAKLKDSRAKVYIEEFGPESWELDALEPSVLIGLVDDAVSQYIDPLLTDMVMDREEELKSRLRDAMTDIDDGVSLPQWMTDQGCDLIKGTDGLDDLERAEEDELNRELDEDTREESDNN